MSASKSKSFSPVTQPKTMVAPIVALLLIATAILAAGCGSSTDEASPSATGTPKEIRIGYQLIPNGDLIVKDQKWLEEALSGTSIKWIKFDSGSDVNTAMIAGSVDIGLAGSSPVAAGLSQPMSIAYGVPWIHDVIGPAESLAARNESGIASFADLVGKKVGTPFGSTAHYSLLASLELNNVDPTKVTIVDLQPPDILASWERGSIDAAYVWNPTLAELKKSGTILVTSAELAEKGKLTADLAVVTNAFAANYPDVVQTWVEQQDRAVKLYRSDPAAATAAVARQLNITADEAAAQMKDLIFLDAAEQAGADYLGTPDAPGKLADNLESASQFLKTQGSVQGVPALTVFQTGLANKYAAAVAGK